MLYEVITNTNFNSGHISRCSSFCCTFFRITSYNVCYTKLLRAPCLLLPTRRKPTGFLQLAFYHHRSEYSINQYSLPAGVSATRRHIVITSYSIHYTKLYETASLNVKEELKRKSRIAAGGLQSMVRMIQLLNPFRLGWLSFQYFSHKILRWTLAPWALIVV